MKKTATILLIALLSIFIILQTSEFAKGDDSESDAINAEYVFGNVSGNCYTNQLYNKEVTLDTDWFMSDASLRAARAGKNLTELLNEIDNGGDSVISLCAMNFDLTDAMKDQQILRMEVLNGTTKYGEDLTIEDYLEQIKQDLPAEIIAFQQEDYTFAGNNYNSFLYTFSEDAPIRYERVIFIKEEDYLAQFQMMASDKAQVENVLQMFAPINAVNDIKESLPEIDDEESVSENNENIREPEQSYLKEYEPVINTILKQTPQPNHAYGIRSDMNHDGIEELIALYLSKDGYFRYIVWGIVENHVKTLFERDFRDPLDQLIIGMVSHNGKTMFLEYSWSMQGEDFIGKYHLLDPETMRSVEEITFCQNYNKKGIVIVPHASFYVGEKQVSEEEYLRIVRSIEFIDVIGISPWQNPNYAKQRPLQDVLFRPDSDDKELKENAQLEIVANRLSAMTGMDMSTDGNGVYFDPINIENIINHFLDILFDQTPGVLDFDLPSILGEESEYGEMPPDAKLPIFFG